MTQNSNTEKYADTALSADIGKALVQEQALPDILKQCTDALVKRLGVMSAGIWLLDRNHKTLALQAASGGATHTALSQIPLGQLHLEHVAKDKKPILSNSLHKEMPPSSPNWLKQEQVVALAASPLMAGKTVLGVVALFSNTSLSESILPLLGSISDQIALSILREQTNTALKKSEATLKSLFSVAPTGIGLVSNRIVLDVNDCLCDMTGYSRKELVGRSAKFLYPTLEEFQRVGYEKYGLVRRHGTGTIETQWLTKDGQPIDVLLSATPLNPSDWTDGIAFTALNITDRKAAEKALRESEVRFRTFFRMAPIPICLNHSDGRFLMVNDPMCDMLGYSEKELLSMSYKDTTHPDDVALTKRQLHSLHNATAKAVTFEKRYVKKNKEIVWGAVSITRLILPGSDNLHYITHILDITQRKKFGKPTFPGAKMKAIGTLAGGIAHDFNNLLMALQGRVSLMMVNISDTNPHLEHLKAMETHIQKAANLTKQLLGFAQGGQRITKPTNLNDLVKAQNYMFGQTRKEITIHGIFEPDLWTVDVDGNQIKQALLNIYINAWQAMPQGGNLFVKTENVTSPDKTDSAAAPIYRKYVKISITDTGTGMHEETRQRVFEPFFTTHQLGKGTGLGLSSTYGIIKNHNGFITVDSEIDRGTTFHIFLPACDDSAVINKKGVRLSMGNNETILLVDDEMIVLEVGKQLLETIGYTVITAECGKDAIDLYKKQHGDIDAVVLDMIMPDVSGEAVLDALMEINPKVKVLLSSGYNQEGKADDLIKKGCKDFIQKPFHLNQFSEKIRSVLKDMP